MKTQQIRQLLSEVFQKALARGGALDAILDLMEKLHAHPEHVISNLDQYFNPNIAPPEFIALYAHWLNLGDVLQLTAGNIQSSSGWEASGGKESDGIARMRELLLVAADICRWRGTRRGLKLFLETATGISGFHIDEDNTDAEGASRPFHIQIHAPEGAARFQQLILKIIEREKPAYVTFDLEFASGGGAQ